jgi:hypothetical protein
MNHEGAFAERLEEIGHEGRRKKEEGRRKRRFGQLALAFTLLFLVELQGF